MGSAVNGIARGLIFVSKLRTRSFGNLTTRAQAKIDTIWSSRDKFYAKSSTLPVLIPIVEHTSMQTEVN